jgi:hypothetical protein
MPLAASGDLNQNCLAGIGAIDEHDLSVMVGNGSATVRHSLGN